MPPIGNILVLTDMPILSKVWAYGDEREMRMKYERMFPHQIRKAIAENWPVVLPLGVLEYHGEHLNVGVDAILVARCLEELEKEMKLVKIGRASCRERV